MDIEQLKLILEMVGVATDAGITIAILFFFLPLLKIIIYFVGWSILIPVVIKAIKNVWDLLPDN